MQFASCAAVGLAARTALLHAPLHTQGCATHSTLAPRAPTPASSPRPPTWVMGGMLSLIFSPSLLGLMPMSLSRMAFSMSLSPARSKGVSSSVLASGTATLAIVLMGVGVP